MATTSPNSLSDLLGSIDHKKLLEAGSIILEQINGEVPCDVHGYLLIVKDLMKKIEWEKQTIDVNSPTYRQDIHFQHFKAIEPTVLDEPNAVWQWMWENKDELQKLVDEPFEGEFSYFSISSMKKVYLLHEKYGGKIIENPQYLFLRVASAIHYPNLTKVRQMYRDMIERKYIPASPTLFNAGRTIQQMSSCFLLRMYDDLSSILWMIHCVGIISKGKGAVGISMGNLRTGTPIGIEGVSEGVLKPEKLVDGQIRYVTQGGKRDGAAQITLPVWHDDIQKHSGATKKIGSEYERLLKADTCIGCYDLFFERVVADEEWSLLCPKTEPLLCDKFGNEFRKLYLDLEASGKVRRKIKARDLLYEMVATCKESGRPFFINLDAINMKSNQKNIGSIVSLNLCQEIALVSDKKRIPSCNLTSICLKRLVKDKEFDFHELIRITNDQVVNLNEVIRRNHYLLPEIEFSNIESAPIGIGFQGAFDALLAMDLIFDSPEANAMIEKIIACVYYNAIKTSCEMAKVSGPYKAFEGSPFSQGKFQFDLWNDEIDELGLKNPKIIPIEPSAWGQDGSWAQLRADVMKYGVVNSQLTTSQPTAGVSTISDCSEAWEPFYTNIFSRSTTHGEFIQVNAYLQDDLQALGLWNQDVVHWIQERNGSIQGLSGVVVTDDPEIKMKLQRLEKKYRTIFEYSQKVIIDQAAIRGPYVDGSQSMNLYFNDPSVKQISAAIIYAWQKRLKTLAYYVRSTQAKLAEKTSINKVDKLYIGENSVVSHEGLDAPVCLLGPGGKTCLPCQ